MPGVRPCLFETRVVYFLSNREDAAVYRKCAVLTAAFVLTVLCASCYYRSWHGWGWDIDVDNDRNDFSFEAEDLWWENWSAAYSWRCDTDVAEVTFSAERDFEGEVSVRIYDDDDYLVFSESFEGEGVFSETMITGPGEPGHWRIRICIMDVNGSFSIRILAQ
jgi:hypothetical protein